MIDDFTDQYGIPQWVLDDEAVEIDAKKHIHKFKAAIDRATAGSKNKPYQPAPGEMFRPEIWTRRESGEIQTFKEWINKAAEGGDKVE